MRKRLWCATATVLKPVEVSVCAVDVLKLLVTSIIRQWIPCASLRVPSPVLNLPELMPCVVEVLMP